MLYEVTMKFQKPPMLTVTINAPNIVSAKFTAQHHAVVGGFGKVKKFHVVEK